MEDASGTSSFVSDRTDDSASASAVEIGPTETQCSTNQNHGNQMPDDRPTTGVSNEKPADAEFAVPAPFSLPLPPSSKTKSKDKESSQSSQPETKDGEPQLDNEKSKVRDSSVAKPVSSSSSSKKASQPQPPMPYKEPEWSGLPSAEEEKYTFDVLKEGKMINEVPLSGKSFHVFGRLPSCDVTLEHPTLSRYHAVMQFSNGEGSQEKGWYIYDLDSTHGTWVNKRKIPPKVYLRVKVGYVIKFGGSTRLHVLQGPSSDQEEESDMTFSEMKDQRELLKKEAGLLKHMEHQAELQRQAAEQKLLQDRGCSWGMGEDAVEEESEEKPFTSLVAENESLYIDDPKKALKGFYEREGCDLPDYQFSEAGSGKHKCVLQLPVDGPNGEELTAEAMVSGKRKDAVIACALEACRILDKLGMLRASTHESRKRKQKKWEDNDFYDSDEDTFLDRTGTIEKKRAMRMHRAGKDETETYESLLEKHTKVTAELKEVESKLAKAKADAEQAKAAAEDQDELEAYMNSIKSGAMDPKTRIRLKGEQIKLKAEEQRLRRLVNIAKPASMPPLKPSFSVPEVKSPASIDTLSKKIHTHQKVVKKQAPAVKKTDFEEKPDNYEEEDEEEETSADQPKANSRLAETERIPQPHTDAPERRESPKASGQGAVKTAVKGPSLPPSMLEELAKGKSSAEAFQSAQKAMSTDVSEASDGQDPD